MPNARLRVLLGAVALVLGVFTAPGARAGVPAEEPATPGRLLLMLDASGSMNAPDPSGLTKIEAAKKALIGVVNALPDTAQVGLRVYGATVRGGKPTPQACADTQLAHPIGPLDRTALTTAITAFRAKGETPIAHSLQQALTDLGTTGKRNIILVSDGEESCVPDPCPVITKLIGTGIDLQIDTVGYAVGTKARTQLQCIANAGHGTYYDAKNADQITASMRKLSTRAVREFAINGKPINGTPAESGAPTLKAGLWVDTLTTGARKHYVLERTIPHSTMRVAVSARPPVVEGRTYNEERIRFDGIPTVDGVVTDTYGGCTSLNGMADRMGMSALRFVVSDMLMLDGGSTDTPTKCGAASVPFWLERTEGTDTPLQVEILVIEEPPLAESRELADPSPAVSGSPTAPVNPRPVIGGTSFSDAPLITPGSWTEQYVPGETIFYRVHLDWGQSLRLTVPSPANRALQPIYDAFVYTPDRKAVGTGSMGMTAGTTTPPVLRVTAPVLYDNRSGVTQEAATSLAGDYYVAVAMPVPYHDTDAGLLFPVTFRVDVEGTPQPGPTYLKPVTPSPSASASAQSEPPETAAKPDSAKGDSLLRWVGGGLLALAVVGGIGYAAWRRRAQRATQA